MSVGVGSFVDHFMLFFAMQNANTYKNSIPHDMS